MTIYDQRSRDQCEMQLSGTRVCTYALQLVGGLVR